MVGYDSDINPLDKPRKTTDRLSLIYFAVLNIAYVGIAVYAFIKGDSTKLKSYGKNNYDYSHMFKEILKTIWDTKWLIIGLFFCSIFFTTLCLYIIRMFSKLIIKVVIVIECIALAFAIISVIEIFFNYPVSMFFSQLISIAILAWTLYVEIYAVLKVGTDFMSAVIKEASRAILNFPLAGGLAVLLAVSLFAVMIFGSAVFMYLASMSVHKSTPFLHVLFQFINAYATVSLCMAISMFGQAVFFGTYGTWFWTYDKSSVPHDTTLRIASIILKYHTGTIAFAASPFIVLPITIYVMIKNLLNRTNEFSHNIFVSSVCWFNIFVRLFNSALVITAIHGMSYMKSLHSVCQLYMRSPLRLYAVSKATEWCAYFMSCVYLLLLYCIALIFITLISHSDSESRVLSVTCLSCILVMLIPFILLLYAAVSSIFISILEDYEKDQVDRSRRSFTKSQIKDLIVDVE